MHVQALVATETLEITFPPGEETTRTMKVPLATIVDQSMITVLLQSYTFSYIDGKGQGFGQLGFDIQRVVEKGRLYAAFTATVSDGTGNVRKWEATIIAVAHFYMDIEVPDKPTRA